MDTARAVAGRFTVIVALGLGLGVLVGGVVGRLMMFLLIRLNPENVGAVSDDGFVMGQFTVSGSLNLLAVGGFLGLVGGVVYAGARHLTFGPLWFRLTSVTLGAALPMGSQIVSTEGVDFTLLSPPELAVAMFVGIPGLYGLLLSVVAERVVAPPPVSWGAMEPLRWVLRAGATLLLAAALVDLVRDLTALS